MGSVAFAVWLTVAETELWKRADEGADLVLGDQALGLGAALLRIALVVGEHQADLGAAEAGKPGVLRQRQIEIMDVVDDVGRRFERVPGIDADLRIGARQRIDDADHDFGGLRAGRDRPRERQRLAPIRTFRRVIFMAYPLLVGSYDETCEGSVASMISMSCIIARPVAGSGGRSPACSPAHG